MSKQEKTNEVSREFLKAMTDMIYWRNNFHYFTGTHYRELPSEDVEIYLMKYMEKNPDYAELSLCHFRNEVVKKIKSICFLSSNAFPPVWIDSYDDSDDGTKRMLDINYSDFDINLENGIFNFKKFLDGDACFMKPHKNTFFSLNYLPYEFDEDARCGTFLNFLNQALPDQKTQMLLQEWFGLNLVPDVSFQKFMLFEGDGANGKSVCCSVLNELVGFNNVSTVPLEAFDPKRLFPLAATIGKLSNICEDVGEISKPAEGLIKQFISGTALTLERKNEPSFRCQTTARLTLATNVLPRFLDRSNGIWRRIVYIPFKNQILDERKQDRRLVNGNFWRNSNELPGVFNWALKGLIRLKKNGAFTTSKECVDAQNEYRRELNTVTSFVDDVCALSTSGKISPSRIYTAYRNWCSKSGFFPLNKINFNKEIKKNFPTVEYSENPLRFDGDRSRAWLGIQLFDDGFPDLKLVDK